MSALPSERHRTWAPRLRATAELSPSYAPGRRHWPAAGNHLIASSPVTIPTRPAVPQSPYCPLRGCHLQSGQSTPPADLLLQLPDECPDPNLMNRISVSSRTKRTDGTFRKLTTARRPVIKSTACRDEKATAAPNRRGRCSGGAVRRETAGWPGAGQSRGRGRRAGGRFRCSAVVAATGKVPTF